MSSNIDIDELEAAIGMVEPVEKEASSLPQVRSRHTAPAFELDDDGEEYMGIGVDGVLASTEKLLAINRGLAEPDERDSLKFQKVMRTHGMLREGIKMDAGKIARTAMYRAAKTGNLDGMGPGVFDGYVTRMLVGNQLTSPLEEINPMQLTENARRITKMGIGGLRSSQSITEDAQAVHPSQFGFIDVVAGPECFGIDTQVLTSTGWVDIATIDMDTKLACRVDGKLEFHKPERVIHEPYSGVMYGVRNKNVSLLVTPGHRFIGSTSGYNTNIVKKAMELHGKFFMMPCAHEPYEGSVDATTYSIGGVHEVSAADWCALLGWFLSEGSTLVTGGKMYDIRIHQAADVHPDEFESIKALFDRMKIPYAELKATPFNQMERGYTKPAGVRSAFKPLIDELSCYCNGCYDKWIPEYVFEWPVEARRAMLDALMRGDGRVNESHYSCCTVCKKLAESVERLMIGLGYCVTMRTEPDKRSHVKTTNYTVCGLQAKWRHTSTRDKKQGDNGSYWFTEEYSGTVHCATVPGGMLYTRREGKPGVWTGNSEKAGIDVRAAWGTKLGGNGRIYQKMLNRRTGRMQWVSSDDLDGMVMKIPD